jgi:hypothetical protein
MGVSTLHIHNVHTQEIKSYAGKMNNIQIGTKWV